MTNGRLKHGDIRETDGFVFWSYHPGVKTGEVWLSHERFMARKESAKANAKKRYHADIEKSRANLRDWHHANKEKKHAAFKRWSDANKARRAEWMAQWVKKNRDKIAAWRSTPKAMARNRKNSAMRRAAARTRTRRCSGSTPPNWPHRTPPPRTRCCTRPTPHADRSDRS